ncbi:carboxypeptidase-like regulatory domain-containing protein [uncultured Dokdonia sp.]|uniref:carboxypeptidase-like regulatory domain-containing protein n=1 Tax=uncultured Dokdonia sp. TaxID=575653 RepID=UPI0026135A42|nr:carboxypeptidase-like regulatory domain-containing protein [uncultured Dokdonia sp.]
MKQITILFIAFHFFGLTNAQTSIHGSVSDRIDPLPWANIYIKNSIVGTVADEGGNFTIDAKKGDTLAISYTGYQTQDIVINNQKEIAIKLEGESLDEVIIVFQEIKMERRPFGCFRNYCNYCTCTSTGIKIEATPNDEASKNTNLSLFPNPSSDGIFNLKMASSYREVNVYVTNLLGQQVASRVYQNTNNRITLDVSSLRTGIYLINSVADGKPLPTQKAIKR